LEFEPGPFSGPFSGLFGRLDLGDDYRAGRIDVYFTFRFGFAGFAGECLFELFLFFFLLFCEIALPLCELIVWFGQLDPLSKSF